MTRRRCLRSTAARNTCGSREEGAEQGIGLMFRHSGTGHRRHQEGHQGKCGSTAQHHPAAAAQPAAQPLDVAQLPQQHPAPLTSSTISSSRLGSWEASQAHIWATSAALEKKAPRRSSSTASAVCEGCWDSSSAQDELWPGLPWGTYADDPTASSNGTAGAEPAVPHSPPQHPSHTHSPLPRTASKAGRAPE